jgi:adenine-specific DNA-methyltransferase
MPSGCKEGRFEKSSVKGDFGFRVFKQCINIRAWDPNPADLEQSLLADQDHLVEGRLESDVLYEMLFKLGLDLCVPMVKRVVAVRKFIRLVVAY